MRQEAKKGDPPVGGRKRAAGKNTSDSHAEEHEDSEGEHDGDTPKKMQNDAPKESPNTKLLSTADKVLTALEASAGLKRARLELEQQQVKDAKDKTDKELLLQKEKQDHDMNMEGRRLELQEKKEEREAAKEEREKNFMLQLLQMMNK